MFSLQKPSMTLLEKSLDAASLRQKVISNNVANVDTPNFKRSDVKFEDILQQELNSDMTFVGRRTDPRHIYIGNKSLNQIQPEVVTDKKTAMNNNKNNVDIDYEMATLAKNQIRYNVLVQQLNQQFKQIKMAIDAGG